MAFIYDPALLHVHKLMELVSTQNVSAEIKTEVKRIQELFEEREAYCIRNTSEASSNLSCLIQHTESHPWEQLYKEGKTGIECESIMLSGNLEAQFLKSLASIGKVKRVLELGLFTGCGALAIAEAMPEDGEVYSCELEPYVAKFAREHLDKSAHGKKVKIRVGPAKDTLLQLGEEGLKFDMIFIDADKTNYLNYYKVIFEKELLAPGGTIVVDNALYYGIPYSYENPEQKPGGPALREFNEYVLNDPRVHTVMLPLRDGVTLIRRKEDIGA